VARAQKKTTNPAEDETRNRQIGQDAMRRSVVLVMLIRDEGPASF